MELIADTDARIWMNGKCVLISERSHMEKPKYCLIPFTCTLERWNLKDRRKMSSCEFSGPGQWEVQWVANEGEACGHPPRRQDCSVIYYVGSSIVVCHGWSAILCMSYNLFFKIQNFNIKCKSENKHKYYHSKESNTLNQRNRIARPETILGIYGKFDDMMG